jgi:hypothetical protein
LFLPCEGALGSLLAPGYFRLARLAQASISAQIRPERSAVQGGINNALILLETEANPQGDSAARAKYK